jgi:hypothetical protein
LEKREKCPDCRQCQQCARIRCRQCLKCAHPAKTNELGPFLTHGEYLEWRKKKYHEKDSCD